MSRLAAIVALFLLPLATAAHALDISGTWQTSDGSRTGNFSWYPSAFPGSFAGDSSQGGVASAWCGAGEGDVEPSPCLE